MRFYGVRPVQVREYTIPHCPVTDICPPGKTTLARVVAKAASEVNNIQYRFVEVSATTTSSNDVKKIFDESSNRLQLLGQRTILFVDEIQRFSRAQQDVFLPVIEKGCVPCDQHRTSHAYQLPPVFAFCSP